MRPSYRSVTPAVVRAIALQHLTAAAAWTPTRAVSVDQLLRFLLLAATQVSSLFDVVRRLLVPYYGRKTKDVVGGPRKAGAKYVHGYATAALVAKGWRYTLAVEPYTPTDRPHDLVRRLLDRIAGSGLKIRGVTADRAFEGGDTLLLLQERRLAYAIPLRRKGNASDARNRLFDRPTDRVHTGMPGGRRARCIGRGSGSSRATGRRTRPGRSRPAGVRRTGCCGKGSRT